MSRRSFAMPDGSRTINVDTYVRAWRRPINKFNKIAGTFTIGFDPGYLLGFKDGRGSVSLPYSMVDRIVKAFEAFGRRT